MLSISRVKDLLNNKQISDKEAQEIRDLLYDLADIAIENWRAINPGQVLFLFGADGRLIIKDFVYLPYGRQGLYFYKDNFTNYRFGYII